MTIMQQARERNEHRSSADHERNPRPELLGYVLDDFGDLVFRVVLAVHVHVDRRRYRDVVTRRRLFVGGFVLRQAAQLVTRDVARVFSVEARSLQRIVRGSRAPKVFGHNGAV